LTPLTSFQILITILEYHTSVKLGKEFISNAIFANIDFLRFEPTTRRTQVCVPRLIPFSFIIKHLPQSASLRLIFSSRQQVLQYPRMKRRRSH